MRFAKNPLCHITDIDAMDGQIKSIIAHWTTFIFEVVLMLFLQTVNDLTADKFGMTRKVIVLIDSL